MTEPAFNPKEPESESPESIADTTSLHRIAQVFADKIIEAIGKGVSIQPLVEEVPHICIIKSAEGVILFANQLYEKAVGVANVVGLSSTNLVQDPIREIDKLSDNLILAGCPCINFTFPTTDENGQSATCRAIKRSLIGVQGNRRSAILLFAEIQLFHETLPSQSTLFNAWQSFSQLDPRDRTIAIQAALGQSMQEIASQLGVTKKTAEVHRASILKAMRISNTHELMRLLVRLQDAGYCELGL